MNIHGDQLSDIDIVQNITEVKGTLRDHQHEIDRLNTDVQDLKNETRVLHELSESVAGMVVGLQYMKDGVDSIKQDQNEIKTEVSTINDKINEIENRPANESRKRFNNIKDSIIIGVAGTIIGAIVTAIISLAF